VELSRLFLSSFTLIVSCEQGIPVVRFTAANYAGEIAFKLLRESRRDPRREQPFFSLHQDVVHSAERGS